MQELGMWTTASGTTAAILELESEDADVGATELPAWASAALQGAAAGAATGAAAGPYGALIGAAAGGAIGAASSAATPAPAAPKAGAPGPAAKPAAKPAADASSRTKVIQALQQFAAVVPVLVQLVAASGQGAKESGFGDDGQATESFGGADWGPESFEGTWTLP